MRISEQPDSRWESRIRSADAFDRDAQTLFEERPVAAVVV
jgi:hypothetical protein